MKPEALTLYPMALPVASKPLANIEGRVKAEFARLAPALRPGMRVAVAVGSRGIANLARIVGALVACLKEAGAQPFIVPAMGSHGGATAQGQAEVLAGYGIDENTMGAPVRSGREVVKLGETATAERLPVYMDRNAYEADGVIAVNRVKVHTDFHAEHESGIIKMLVIGLGKQAQAAAVHSYGTRGLRQLILPAAQVVLAGGKVLGGLAILEDGTDATSDIAMAPAAEMAALDKAFLARSRQMLARLPWQALDVLIVDAMGKEISGTGMDTNVIGRMCIRGEADGPPHCTRIAVLDLTPQSHGNALGIGLADIITRRLADKVDWAATRENVITSGFLERGFTPVVCESDREAIRLAAMSCGVPDPAMLRVAHIKNTLQLANIEVSAPLLEGGLPAAGGRPLAFSAEGALENRWP